MLYDDVRTQIEIDRIVVMSDVDIAKKMMHNYMIKLGKVY